MKSLKIKNKALELYIGNVSVEKICKKLKLAKTTFYKWHKSGKWKELRTKAIQEADEKTTNELINVQTELGRLASEQLLERLKDNELKNPELVSIAKHGLEVVRPKQTTNNLNITKNEQNNTAIEVVIPKEVNELLEGEKVIEV